MSVFNIIQEQLHRIAWTISTVVQGKVSLDRYNDFLKDTELLDEFSAQPALRAIEDTEQEEDTDHENPEPAEIGFRKATFAWSAESSDGTLTPRSRSFRLTIKDELLFMEGGINLIIGPT